MKTWLKLFLITIIILIAVALIGLSLFMYKAEHGFAKYETTPPSLEIPKDQPAILLFSKTTGFRHGAAIDASKIKLAELAQSKGWFLYDTEDAGIVNEHHLSQFEIIIWNNSTGPVLTDYQRTLVKKFVESGGGLIGIHGAGDSSHKWPWYNDHLIGAKFSHHPIKNHIQKAIVEISTDIDSSWNVSPQWQQNDEWYVFFSHPKEKGFQTLYYIDGASIDPNGNLLWITDKTFGMGKDHPVAWFKNNEKGRSFYTSMGHTPETFSHPDFMKMMEKAITWSGRL